MTLRLTPEILEGAYEFLRATPPFNRWKLPPADEVQFRVMHSREWMGQYTYAAGEHVIDISSRLVGHTGTLIETMAHEMTHLALQESGQADKSEHGERFERCAARVARLHGFDPKRF